MKGQCSLLNYQGKACLCLCLCGHLQFLSMLPPGARYLFPLLLLKLFHSSPYTKELQVISTKWTRHAPAVRCVQVQSQDRNLQRFLPVDTASAYRAHSFLRKADGKHFLNTAHISFLARRWGREETKGREKVLLRRGKRLLLHNGFVRISLRTLADLSKQEDDQLPS